MGRANRIKPARLAAKLHAIRKSFNLTMKQMIVKLDCEHIPLYPASIAEYEKGKREPPLPVLLAYARAANVYIDALVDDEVGLPEKLPAGEKNAGVKRKPQSKRSKS
jgi:transcriptional regulator with XRE-family HTH domain